MLQTILEELSLYIILGLPKRSRSTDSILVIFDRFSKMRHLIACNKVNNENNITFDHDVKFTSHFWKELWKRFDTILKFSSVYHR